MPGFTSRDDIINELTVNGKKDEFNFYKVSSAPEAAGVWHSLWPATGNPGAGTTSAGATPGTAWSSDSTTPVSGSMYFPDRSTDQRYLLSFGAVATQNCTLMLYDRLAGVNVTLASASQTLNTTALTRYTGTDATLNEAWLEMTTASTAAGANIGLSSYTSGDGTTAVDAVARIALPAAATNVQAMVQLPLAASEQGIRAAATLAVGTTATAGVAHFLIISPLARIRLLANDRHEGSFPNDVLGLPRIYDDATLGLAFLASGTTATTFWGNITCAYG